MNNFKLSAVAIIASLVLTACGGGGGNNSNNQPKESTVNQTASTQPTPRIDFEPMPSRIVGQIDSNDYESGTIEKIWKNGDGKEKAKMLAENQRYTWNGIIVRSENPSVGQQLINLDQKILLNTETNRANLSTLGLDSNLNHTFKGYITSHDSETFYQIGLLTPDTRIPTSGKATYKGNALRYDMVSLRPRGVGETVLNVDFTNKKIEGKITTENHRRNIILLPTSLGTKPENTTTQTNSAGEEEKIPLAIFSGKAIAEGNLIYPKDVEGTYRGGLAGPNAEEAAGIVDFGSTEQVSGETPVSFSAVKQ